ncbi:unnamed protein product [Ectocarpus fasciculatus]
MARSPSLRYQRRTSRFRTALVLAAAVAAALAASLLAATAAAAAAQEAVDLPQLTISRVQTEDQGRVRSGPRQGPGRGPGGYKEFSSLPMMDVGEECTPSPLWVKDVDTSSYELGCEEIEAMLANNTRLVGEGRLRKVYLAEYGDQTVAVKVLQEEQEIRAHRVEVATMDAVRGNPYIVQTLGICNTTLVTEAFTVTVQLAMHRRRKTALLPIGEAVNMSLDAVRGLQALHEAVGGPIVHFDVKPIQLMVTDSGRVKLNDFNVAWFMSRGPDGQPCPFNMVDEFRGHGSPWRSPEYLSRKPMTEKIDIYRMGLVFKQVLAAAGVKMPVAQESEDDVPVFPTTWHRSYYEVVQDMLAVEATQRPSAREVVWRLRAILDELPQPP